MAAQHNVNAVYLKDQRFSFHPQKILSRGSLRLPVVELTSFTLFMLSGWFFSPEETDGDLKMWINRERFRSYSKIDSYTLYSMGDTGSWLHLDPQQQQWGPGENSVGCII